MSQDSRGERPTLERILQIATGAWGTCILGAAVRHRIFTHLAAGPRDAAEVARAADVSLRGAQALLDGAAGLGLLRLLPGGRYENAPDAAAFLVEGAPTYGGGFAEVMLGDLSRWAGIAEVVRTGVPEDAGAGLPENPFWERLVPSIAVLSLPVADIAAERLGIARGGPVSWLDVGGGSGVYSAVWLGKNPAARATQLDWANVNRIARGFVGRFGVGDRFRTIDGDFHTTDFGEGYDYAIFSHIAHQEPPDDNRRLLAKFRRALKPGGTLVISDFVLGADRRGHPFAMMFSANMLVFTRGGAAYRDVDYRAWLTEAGFAHVDVVPTPTAATLIFAS
jgi:SAM-dependent methyltransferase